MATALGFTGMQRALAKGQPCRRRRCPSAPSSKAPLTGNGWPLCRRPLRCSATPDGTSMSDSEPSLAAQIMKTQQIRTETIQPLRVALNESIARHTKATGMREALEAEVCALFERVITAEGSEDVSVQEVAAAAMRAVESAVKDEVEAAAVVAATQAALDKTLSELQALDSTTQGNDAALLAASGPSSLDSALDATATAAAAAAAMAAMVGNGSTSASNGSDAKAGGSAVADTVQRLDSLLPTAGLVPAAASADALGAAASISVDDGARAGAAKKKAKQQAQLVRLLMLAAGAAALYVFAQSAAGEAVMDAVRGVGAMISERIGPIHIGEAERGLLETIWLLLTSIICVPLVCKLIPGGSPVLGYLIGGALVGPHALNIISDVHQVSHLAELGVVFLLFNIGLELSLDRLQSMAKYVFGMGAVQVGLSVVGVAAFASVLAGLPGPSAIILGGALAMSTTAVAIQVLEDRGEMGSRHGRATFSVLLFQDLAVVVLLMLIPLLAPDPSGASSGGMAKIAQALGLAAVKAVLCIAGITAVGRIGIRPLYRKISGLSNAEIFAATTLLVVLGTSLMTQLAGLSLALGAFLAGLLLAETEYALQVESDIAPYKGLLMGLFFMTVGMQISVGLFIAKWKSIVASMVLLLSGKLAVMVAAGQMFGLSRMSAIRAGLLLATGGEFAFVAFGEAVSKGVLPQALISELYLVVALSMAVVPYLAMLGSKLGQMFEKTDMKALQPQEGEVKELRNHVIIAGYGRVGQIIAQMLSEELIPFVALDVRSDRVQTGMSADLPVYFGDAGSPAVLHSVGAERAACAVVTLDTPGANYRTVWALHKHYPHVKTYVRAHDVNHALNLEKAGASVVVPETLEPSLQLAAAVLSEFEMPPDEVSSIVDKFRKNHLSELQAIAAQSGTSLGYTVPKMKAKEPAEPAASGDESMSSNVSLTAVA